MLLLVRVRIGCIIGVHDSIVREGDWDVWLLGLVGLPGEGATLLTV